jgi:YfiH family protein
MDSAVPFYSLGEWSEKFPWILAGITYKGSATDPFDLRLEDQKSRDRMERIWQSAGFGGLVRIPQVHGTDLAVHDSDLAGLVVLEDSADGHATSGPGMLLAITVADCVPVYLLDSENRVVMLLHAGWRGVASGIINKGIELFSERWQSNLDDIYVHLGPAICGSCYEVGPEVFENLGLIPPAEPTPVNLRAILEEQVSNLGVREDRITISEHCTLCSGGDFFSHRKGDLGRQAALIGIRP